MSEFQAALREAISTDTDFLFTHDVEVTLTLFVAEKDRYQTQTAADLDNVIKPLLDAVTGPSGIMIDDNQVQSIRASWMTPGPVGVGVGFELEFQSLMPDDTATRAHTAFVEFSSDRCYILPGLQPEFWPRRVGSYRNMLTARQDLLNMGIVEDVADQVLPISRPFPRQRLLMHHFPVYNHTTFQDLHAERSEPHDVIPRSAPGEDRPRDRDEGSA
ncbi:RusA family crossover junction endodeoxyribonuclease [Microbacterium sp. 22215]|uniref:RusA family crossover junction endodeoxyribonuclease n=1 Tax=Microbacterium sp. 22215 TaxID=3453893 RepID=UPI003F830C07